jgi:hypothetical protein
MIPQPQKKASTVRKGVNANGSLSNHTNSSTQAIEPLKVRKRERPDGRDDKMPSKRAKGIDQASNSRDLRSTTKRRAGKDSTMRK